MSYIAYLRKSTNDQPNSFDTQEHAIRTAIQQTGGTLVRVYKEEASGKNVSNRPILKEAITNMKPNDTLCVSTLDRLTRSVKDMKTLQDEFEQKATKKHLWVVDRNLRSGNSRDTFSFNLFMTFAEEERRVIADRVKTQMADLKRRGLVYTTCEYGYTKSEPDKDGKLWIIEEPHEQEILAYIKNIWSENKKMTYKQVIKDLTDKGYTKRCGSPWDLRSLHRLKVKWGWIE